MPDDTGVVDDAPDAGVTYYEVQSIITCLKCESTEPVVGGFFSRCKPYEGISNDVSGPMSGRKSSPQRNFPLNLALFVKLSCVDSHFVKVAFCRYLFFRQQSR